VHLVGFIKRKLNALHCYTSSTTNCPICILIYIQQDATLHSLFYLETVLHVSGGFTTHNQERKQLYLYHLIFVRPLLLPAHGVTNTKCCRYSCLRS